MFKLFTRVFVFTFLIFMIACGGGSGSKTQTTPGPGPGPDPKSIVGDYVGNATETRSAADKIIVLAEPLPETIPAVVHIEDGDEKGEIQGGLLTPDGLFFFEGTFDKETGVFVIMADEEEETFEGDGTYNSETKCISGDYSYVNGKELVEGEFTFCQDEDSISNIYCLSYASSYDSTDKGIFIAGLLVFDEDGLADTGEAILVFEDDEEELIWNDGNFDGTVLNVGGKYVEFFGTLADGIISGDYDADDDFGAFALASPCVDPTTLEPKAYSFNWVMPLRYRIRSNGDIEKQSLFSLRGPNGAPLSVSETNDIVTAYELEWPDGVTAYVGTNEAGTDKFLKCDVITNGPDEYKLDCLQDGSDTALDWGSDVYVSHRHCRTGKSPDCDEFPATPAGTYTFTVTLSNGTVLTKVFDYPGDTPLETIGVSAEWANPPVAPLVACPSGELLIYFEDPIASPAQQMRFGIDLIYFTPGEEWHTWRSIGAIKIPNQPFADMVTNNKPLRVDGNTLNGMDAELRPFSDEPIEINVHTQSRYYEDGTNYSRAYAHDFLNGWLNDCE